MIEEKIFAQIHLPEWQFYLPRGVGQWDMSSLILCSKDAEADADQCKPSLALMVQFMSQYWYRRWLGADNMTVHNLNQFKSCIAVW